ncbi:MAG: ABC transporter permease, partial [Defluviitaleaceae bacterium]|nr:ABC transporter permease [Defluviitaleaceae bacterium]
AFLIGFRPSAGFFDWLAVAGILLLAITAISWIAVLCGLISKSPETSAGLMLPLFILPFISSGFAPTETLPTWLRTFAENQPMSPIINSTRALMLDLPLEGNLPPALTWCIGITAVAFAAAVYKYKRKLV